MRPLIVLLLTTCALAAEPVYPGRAWETQTPAEVGLNAENLKALSEVVGGRGVVIQNGYQVFSWGDISKASDIASAFKPLLSHLLLVAIQEERIKSADSLVADFEPRLRDLNGGKDAAMTWRHLASQSSGYGLIEAPGKAWAYNDFALALYYDTLTQKLFESTGDELLEKHLAQPLGFEDKHTFNAFGAKDRPGRLAISPRDFARFGLLYLRNGKWRDKQLLDPKLIELALSSRVPADLPQSSGRDADMLAGQRSIGGKKTITPRGPGQYSFNWWINGKDPEGKLLRPELPADTFIASGHGGKRHMIVIRSRELIVCWNDAAIEGDDDPKQAKAAAPIGASLGGE